MLKSMLHWVIRGLYFAWVVQLLITRAADFDVKSLFNTYSIVVLNEYL